VAPLKEKVGIAVDMCGCPNACRHCWLGRAQNKRLSVQDVRRVAEQFRGFFAPGQAGSAVKGLVFSTCFREPDFSDDYKQLYELEAELSDGRPARYELLSVWRLARDPEYAPWAGRVGPGKCQIKFFGLAETHDWFCRRKGAFRDSLTATERLLEAGMKPRWQLFLTRKILPELGGLLELAEKLKLRERVAALGGEFEIFMQTPGPDGEARKIEHLRPSVEDLDGIPEAIVEATRKYRKKDTLWRTERQWYQEILSGSDRVTCESFEYPELWFFVTPDMDVFSNLSTLEPWWRLGNLESDPVESIVDAYLSNRALGLETIYTVPARALAGRYGDPDGRLVYDCREDLESLYVARHCQDTYAPA